MKNNFKEQFQNLRDIIKSNVVTLKGLITQSTQLSELIPKLAEKQGNEDITVSLKNTQAEIDKSIASLVEQTQKLFAAYDKLVDEVFGK
jgi:hypothetical protein